MKNRHHRLPKSKGGKGTHASGNISRVDEKKHQAYHLLFDNKDPYEIANILTQVWIDPKFKLVAIRRTK